MPGNSVQQFTTPSVPVANNQTVIKVAMLVAQNDTDFGLPRKNSMLRNAGGAIPLALEQLWADEFIHDFGADAIIPTTCMDVAPQVGHLAANFNIPMIVWGQNMVSNLASSNNATYPTLLNIVPNYKYMASGLTSLLQYFNWTQFGVVIQSDLGNVSGGCDYLAKDIDNSLATSNITVNYKTRIFNVQSSDMDKIANSLQQRARIILLCFDDKTQLRSFALNLFDGGLITKDFVYLIPDNDMSMSFNLSLDPFWVQKSAKSNGLDGRDADAEVIGRLAFWVGPYPRWWHYDITLSALSNRNYYGFYERVVNRTYGWPFYCPESECGAVSNGSLNSILLYDAIYNYGMALNESFKQFGIRRETYRNGSLLATNNRKPFMGLTGYATVETDRNTRVFVLSNRKSDSKQSPLCILMQLAWTNGELNVTMRNTSSLMWFSHGGTVPPAVPTCGFDGNGCTVSVFDLYKGYFMGGIALFVLIIGASIFCVAYLIHAKIVDKQKGNLQWKIPFVLLQRQNQRRLERRTTERSHHSLHSNQTNISALTHSTIGSLAQSKRFTLYVYNGQKCIVHAYGPTSLAMPLSAVGMAECRTLRLFDHVNLNRFLGLSLDGPNLLAVWNFCARGSLKDVIMSGNAMVRDVVFIQSSIRELCEGLHFLHNSPLQFHGRLKSSVCLINDRWQVKISYFGLRWLKNTQKIQTKNLLWLAPEQLRKMGDNTDLIDATKQSDIYSLALIFTEMVNMAPCWETNNGDDEADSDESAADDQAVQQGNAMSRRRTTTTMAQHRSERRALGEEQQRRTGKRRQNSEEIVYLVKRGGLVPLRPTIRPALDNLNPELIHLIRDCWVESPGERPTIEKVRQKLRQMNAGQSINLMDHVFGMLEQYANKLEEDVHERTRELEEEKRKSDILLYRMMPRQVANSLKLGQSVEPEQFECVTVFFSDIVQFAALSNQMRPLHVVNLMNELYSIFDAIVDEHDVYKVESIGDGYLCVSGLPNRNGNLHAKQCADMALKFLNSLQYFRISDHSDQRIRLRIGLHSGPCVAGVVGLAMPRYCLFGDTVNTASRMESSSSANKIHISKETCILLHENSEGGAYLTESRGEVIIKGKGVMETFWLLGNAKISVGTMGTNYSQAAERQKTIGKDKSEKETEMYKSYKETTTTN
ncbi:hypothetical protein niasHT_034923 [Heterodera trifolii]|uniref:Guanylate cyclase n=1 Tax=Heterodera trifolii TaxID=157864 RepID=A0ABD2I5P0_9BILA